MDFTLSDSIDCEKVFLTKWNKVSGKRFDPFFYIPSLSKLENQLKVKTDLKLRDFAITYAGGATPKTTETEKYYSDAKNGIPLLRVQNLSATGKLSLHNLKYINKKTHNNYLSRSKVTDQDLLVKITGVGRMAIASVPPTGFEGNINQHIVVIRTGSREISENLAAYMNLDFVEKLASFRATGGTRPALDYTALFSIPIISNRIIFNAIENAVTLKQQKEQDAQNILDSINSYLLKELGIELPPKEETGVEARIFTKQFSEVSERRFEPKYYTSIYSNNEKCLKSSPYPQYYINKVTDLISDGTHFTPTYTTDGVKFISVKDIRKSKITFTKTKFITHREADTLDKRCKPQKGDVLFTKIGTFGYAAVVKTNERFQIFVSVALLRPNKSVDPQYLEIFLNSNLAYLQYHRVIKGSGVPDLHLEDIRKIQIILPPIEFQKKISNHIYSLIESAKQLKQEAETILTTAKAEVEQMILGGE